MTQPAQIEEAEDIPATLQLPTGERIETSVRQLKISAEVMENPDLHDAVKIIVKEQKVGTTFLQRAMSIGYNKAARLVEAMEDLGMITAADHIGKREVLVAEVPAEFENAARAALLAGQHAPRMKETDADREVRDQTYRVAADELRSFIERFERLDAEKRDIAGQQKKVMAEAKGRGYDTAVMRKIIALRKRDSADIAEEEAVMDLYKQALSM